MRGSLVRPEGTQAGCPEYPELLQNGSVSEAGVKGQTAQMANLGIPNQNRRHRGRDQSQTSEIVMISGNFGVELAGKEGDQSISNYLDYIVGEGLPLRRRDAFAKDRKCIMLRRKRPATEGDNPLGSAYCFELVKHSLEIAKFDIEVGTDACKRKVLLGVLVKLMRTPPKMGTTHYMGVFVTDMPRLHFNGKK
jgi:hypothetical protein